MTDMGAGQPPAPDLGRPSPSFPQTTKPRQMPGGGAGGMGMPSMMPGAPPAFDPNMNGASTLTAPPSLGQEPVTDDPVSNPDTEPVTDDTSPRVAAIAADILSTNPGLSPRQARRLAERAFSEYISREPGWESNPIAVVASQDLPDDPEGQGEPLPPERPEPRQPDGRTDQVGGRA